MGVVLRLLEVTLLVSSTSTEKLVRRPGDMLVVDSRRFGLLRLVGKDVNGEGTLSSFLGDGEVVLPRGVVAALRGVLGTDLLFVRRGVRSVAPSAIEAALVNLGLTTVRGLGAVDRGEGRGVVRGVDLALMLRAGGFAPWTGMSRTPREVEAARTRNVVIRASQSVTTKDNIIS